MSGAKSYKNRELGNLLNKLSLENISSSSIATALVDGATYFNPATTKIMLKTVATILSTE